MKGARTLLGTLTLAALALSGCEFGPTETGRHRAEREALRAARSRWESRGPADYGYVVASTCFCAQDAAGPVRVEVRGRQTFSSTYVSSGAPASPKYFSSRDTVDDLFDTIHRALEDAPDEVRVTYHRELGYPVEAYFDFDRRTADEEQGFTVREFRAGR